LKEFSNKSLFDLENLKNDEDGNYKLIYSQLLKSPVLNLNAFAFFSYNSLNASAMSTLQQAFLNDKNVYLTFAEFDLFAADSLFILSEVTTPFVKNNTVYFFSYFSSRTPLLNIPNSSLNLTTPDFKILKLELSANSDKNNFFLQDVSQLTRYTHENFNR
jgi:hypothetical protein